MEDRLFLSRVTMELRQGVLKLLETKLVVAGYLLVAPRGPFSLIRQIMNDLVAHVAWMKQV